MGDNIDIKCYPKPVDFYDLMTVLFFAMQMMGYIDWPWYLLIMPLLVRFGVAVILYICTAAAVKICDLREDYKWKKRKKK